jgi:dihydroxy-acid dehydratase
MTLDVAMGGSTNTVLHLLAAAPRRASTSPCATSTKLSRRVPVLCKVAPAKADVHMEDVHRAGGVMAILGELDRRGLLNELRDGARGKASGQRSTAGTSCATGSEDVKSFFRAAPAAFRPLSPSARTAPLPGGRYGPPDGVIRNAEHAFSKDGGLAVLYGNSPRTAAS